MTDTIKPHPAHDDLIDQDPAFRREVCERYIEEASELQLSLSNRFLRLLKRYELGELSMQELERELRRPFFQ